MVYEPVNYLDEARKGLNLPERVYFHDITLRDGEQQAGIALTRDDKVAIARRLADTGVDRIEALLPFEEVARIVSEQLKGTG